MSEKLEIVAPGGIRELKPGSIYAVKTKKRLPYERIRMIQRFLRHIEKRYGMFFVLFTDELELINAPKEIEKKEE